MKRLIVLTFTLVMLLSSCGNKKVYRPSLFPEGQANNYSFAIPYLEKNNSIIVRIRLNGGPQFEGVWDSGCSLPLKISSLEAAALEKDGTLSKESDYLESYPVKVANGQINEYDVYLLKSVSFVDDNGEEHMLKNVPAIIDDNVGTNILIGLPIMQELGYSHEISQYDQFIYFKE